MNKIKILHIGLSATGTPINGLQKALMKLGDYEEINTVTPNINQVIIQKSNYFKPDLVWIQIQTAGFIHNETADYLRKNGAFVINWSGDCRSPIPSWYLDFGRHINLTTFSNINDVETLNNENINADFLQIGYDPEIYTPIGSKIPMQEIVFLGNNLVNEFPLSQFRAEMVLFLQNKYGNNFGVYGNGWRIGNGSYMNSQLGEASLYRSTKIAINCSHFDYKRYTSDRLFRILGSGTFCLSKWYPEIEKDFIDGENLVIWKDLNDLEEKIDFYLKNDIERNKIANNGHKLAINNYTFDHMGQNIKKLYNEYK
jgi:spore maturation protein CgeB